MVDPLLDSGLCPAELVHSADRHDCRPETLFFNLRRLRAKIESKKGHEGLGDEGRRQIAKELDVNIRDVEDMEARHAANDQSLNATIGEDGETDWQSFLADSRPNPEDVVIGMNDAQTRSAWRNRRWVSYRIVNKPSSGNVILCTNL